MCGTHVVRRDWFHFECIRIKYDDVEVVMDHIFVCEPCSHQHLQFLRQHHRPGLLRELNIPPSADDEAPRRRHRDILFADIPRGIVLKRSFYEHLLPAEKRRIIANLPYLHPTLLS